MWNQALQTGMKPLLLKLHTMWVFPQIDVFVPTVGLHGFLLCRLKWFEMSFAAKAR